MHPRPLDLNLLEKELLELAAHAGLAMDTPHLAWYDCTGIAQLLAAHPFLAINPAWAGALMPAASQQDLVRRCLLWDPLYRLHVDLGLAATLHAIAAEERWQRFEYLMCGPFQKFAPRFVALIEWVSRQAQAPGWKLTPADWRRMDILAEKEPAVVAVWDEYNWGTTRTEDHFPLYEVMYIPLHHLPVGVNLQQGNPDERLLLGQLIKAAAKGEGIYADYLIHPMLESLSAQGMPIRIHNGPQPLASLAGAVCGLGYPPEEHDTHPLNTPLPEPAAKSRVLPISSEMITSDLWHLVDNADTLKLHPAAGVDSGANAWPQPTSIKTPPWGTLPPLEVIEEIGRKDSPDADDAINRLAGHGIMGFWIQILLLEALDRELGLETLMLAPPTDRRVEEIEVATQIYYQPRPKKTGKDETRTWQMTALGNLDAVFNDVAAQVGIYPLPLSHNTTQGIWSFTLGMLRRAKLVKDLHDRLIMDPRLLDRLHGGGMMRSIIRRGQPFRDKNLHAALEAVWRERMIIMGKEV